MFTSKIIRYSWHVIILATTDVEILACLPVVQELRPHLCEQDFVARIRAQEATGYRLAYLRENEEVITVAGYRLGENLAWGRYLYVDDLVTAVAHRSSGHGKRMLDWLRERARAEDCVNLHLDSGLQRIDAHRFYRREGMSPAGYHFAEDLAATSPHEISQPRAAYYAAIFTSRRHDGDLGYAAMASHMLALARRQPGFFGVESARDANLGITVSYWLDLASIRAWKASAEHAEAQRLGKEIWYREYRIRIARVEDERYFPDL